MASAWVCEDNEEIETFLKANIRKCGCVKLFEILRVSQPQLSIASIVEAICSIAYEESQTKSWESAEARWFIQTYAKAYALGMDMKLEKLCPDEKMDKFKPNKKFIEKYPAESKIMQQ